MSRPLNPNALITGVSVEQRRRDREPTDASRQARRRAPRRARRWRDPFAPDHPLPSDHALGVPCRNAGRSRSLRVFRANSALPAWVSDRRDPIGVSVAVLFDPVLARLGRRCHGRIGRHAPNITLLNSRSSCGLDEQGQGGLLVPVFGPRPSSRRTGQDFHTQADATRPLNHATRRTIRPRTEATSSRWRSSRFSRSVEPDPDLDRWHVRRCIARAGQADGYQGISMSPDEMAALVVACGRRVPAMISS